MSVSLAGRVDRQRHRYRFTKCRPIAGHVPSSSLPRDGRRRSRPPSARASALFVNREGDRLLFDCGGEGTQRGMMRFGTGFGIDHLFVSHLHGDHVLGIPGLVQTLGFNDRAEPLTIHCPPGTEDDLHDLVHGRSRPPRFRFGSSPSPRAKSRSTPTATKSARSRRSTGRSRRGTSSRTTVPAGSTARRPRSWACPSARSSAGSTRANPSKPRTGRSSSPIR